MQAPTPRPRRAPPTTWHLRRHRVAMAVMRALLRSRRPRRPARADPPKVTILLVHAWGMGGTIRTMHNVAGRLAERHEVEVVSVWRTRDDPFFPFAPGVTVTAAEDRRPGAGGPVARLLRRVPGSLLYPRRSDEREHDAVDRRPAPAGALADPVGVLIGTRPALNLLVSQVGRGPVRGGGRACPVPALQRVAQARDPPPLRGARRRRRARRGRARGVRARSRTAHAGGHDPERGAGAAGRAGAARGPDRRRGRAAPPGQGLRPPDPGLRHGRRAITRTGGCASAATAASARRCRR